MTISLDRMDEQLKKDIAILDQVVRQDLTPGPFPAREGEAATPIHYTAPIELEKFGIQKGAGPGSFLIVLTGLPGTGKSFFARALANRMPFLILESDRLRKALAPKPRYTSRESARLFSACHYLIGQYLTDGRRIIFDATNLRESHRQPLCTLANSMNTPIAVVRLTAPEQIVRHRLAERITGANGLDYSDADWRVYRRMLPTEESVDRECLTVDSSQDISPALEQVIRLVSSLSVR